MAAGDEIVGKIRIMKQTIRGDRVLVLDERYCLDLDQTTPDKALYVNGGAPGSTGVTVPSAGPPVGVFNAGERLIVQIKPVASGKIFDSDGPSAAVANADYRIGIRKRDQYSGARVDTVLVDTDRDTSQLADDPTLTTANQWYDVLSYLVPIGERWQLWGQFKLRSVTTA
jgi:hypothetical protein